MHAYPEKPQKFFPEKDTGAYGLYVHWPFCLSKCPYCDFNSHVRTSIDEHLWEKALLCEMARVHEKDPHKTLTSIFFGGGTPSLMSPSLVEKVIQKAVRLWSPDKDLEITLEANPSTFERKRFEDFRLAGVNRVSLGGQSLRDHGLQFLGRQHSAAELLKALHEASRLFPRYSFDLIYACPYHTLKTWQQELSEALALGASHMSLYQLTIEKGTPFYAAYHRGDFTMPSEDESLAYFQHTHHTLSSQGFEAYEVSNFAKPGHRCRHNLLYWRYDAFGAIGPGSHGRRQNKHGWVAYRRHRYPEKWLQDVLEYGESLSEETNLTQDESFEEAFMMGLRVREGIDLPKLQGLHPKRYQHMMASSCLQRLCQAGFVQHHQTRLWATPKGREVLNTVIHTLLSETFSEYLSTI